MEIITNKEELKTLKLKSKTNLKLQYSPFPSFPNSYKMVFEIEYLYSTYKLKAYLFNKKGNYTTYFLFFGLPFYKSTLFEDVKKMIYGAINTWDKKIGKK